MASHDKISTMKNTVTSWSAANDAIVHITCIIIMTSKCGEPANQLNFSTKGGDIEYFLLLMKPQILVG